MRSLLRTAFLLGLCALPFAVRADTLGLSPASGSYVVGKVFPVNVYVSSTGQSVNAVSGTLSFPADKLQIVSISKTGSVLTLWVSDPTFNNYNGTASFEGVVPNPGFQGSNGRIVTVNFKVIGQGPATVKWSSGSVLANDGNGTNILKNLFTATYTLGGAAPADTTPVPEAPAPEPAAGGIKVTSDNYPDSGKWYSVDSATFSWNLPDGASAVKILVGRQPNSTPTVLYDPPVDTKKVDNIDDGIWYFHLQAKSGSGWGPTTHFQFRVDSTPPESVNVKMKASNDTTDPRPKFVVSASDSTSGIDHYTFQIDDAAPVTWRDDGSGVWQPAAVKPGKHSLLTKVYDEAGNSSPASSDFTVAAIEGANIDSYTERASDGGSISVKGTSRASSKVFVVLRKTSFLGLAAADSSTDGPNSSSRTTQSNSSGSWSTALDTSNLNDGTYDLTAIVVDDRGAESIPTAARTVFIGAPWYQTIGGTLLKVLAISIPVLALIFALVVVFLRGFHHVRMSNRKFATELNNIERLVDKSFVLLKEDVEDSIRLLERTKSRRRLTDEEDAIIERLRSNLHDAEKVIHGEVRRVERQLD